MASDVWLMIFDPRLGAMIRARWLGQSDVRDLAHRLRVSPPVASADGESWQVTPGSAIEIAAVSYADGAKPAEVTQLAQRFPATHYWWFLDHSY